MARNGITADWVVALKSAIESAVRAAFPADLRNWPLMQPCRFDAYSVADTHQVLVLHDQVGGTMLVGPGAAAPLPHGDHPPPPRSSQDAKAWQDFLNNTFRLRSEDAAIVIPLRDSGTSSAANDLLLFTAAEQSIWEHQVALIVERQASVFASRKLRQSRRATSNTKPPTTAVLPTDLPSQILASQNRNAPMKMPVKFETAFDTYDVEHAIGSGGNGNVYACRSAAGLSVAIKCLRPTEARAEKLRRFRNEIGFCQRTDHPNIVRVLDSGWVQEQGAKCPFYVMDRYDGTLRNAASANPQPSNILPLFAQLLDGVEAAHLLHTWHRDLKPENVLWKQSTNSLVVADFGIAHFCEDDLLTAVETKADARLANFVYAAPEQKVRGQGHAVNHRADIFALGLILHELLTGVVIQGTGYKRIGEAHAHLSWLDDLVDRMVRNTADERIGSIADIKKAMLARQQDYIQQQRVDSERRRVQPSTTLSDALVTPITIVGQDWTDGMLLIQLDREPPQGWAEALRGPHSGVQYVPGSGSDAARLVGKIITVRASADDAKRVFTSFTHFIPQANQRFKAHLEQSLREQEAVARNAIRNSLAKEELRLRVLRELGT